MLPSSNSIDFIKSLEELSCIFVESQTDIKKPEKTRLEAKLKKNLSTQFFSFLFSQHLEKNVLFDKKWKLNKEMLSKPKMDLESLRTKLSIFSFT